MYKNCTNVPHIHCLFFLKYFCFDHFSFYLSFFLFGSSNYHHTYLKYFVKRKHRLIQTAAIPFVNEIQIKNFPISRSVALVLSSLPQKEKEKKSPYQPV